MLIPIKSAEFLCIALRIKPKLDVGGENQKRKEVVPQRPAHVYQGTVGEVATDTVTSAEPPLIIAREPVTFGDILVGVHGSPAGRADFFSIASGVAL